MFDAGSLLSAVWGLVLAIVQLLVSLSLATATVYLGLRLFDKSTKRIEEIKEIKKGNVAVAIYMAAVVLSIASVVQVGVENLTALISPSQSVSVMMVGLLVGVLQLLIGLAAAVVAINIALRVFDTVTPDIDLTRELKRKNIAVAILVAGILLAISFVIRAGVGGLINAADPAQLALFIS